MNKLYHIVALMVGILLFVPPAAYADAANAGGVDASLGDTPKAISLPVQAKAVSSQLDVKAGQQFHVAIDLKFGPGWYYYSPDPKGNIPPATIAVNAGNLTAAEPLWPMDVLHKTVVGDETLVNNVYNDNAIIYLPITVPSDAKPGKAAISVTVRGQICKDVCMPLGDNVVAQAEVTVGDKAVDNPQWQADKRFSQELAAAMTAKQLKDRHDSPPKASAHVIEGMQSMTVLGGLGAALLAGMILNVMPCVLPVIPLKILSLIHQAGGSRKRYVTLGLAFAGGVLAFFAMIAMASILIKAITGSAFAWAAHFQSRIFIVAMAALMGVLAANMLGLFNVLAPRSAGRMAQKVDLGPRGHQWAFGLGLLTGLLSTPCSFATLTIAVAWAQTQVVWMGIIGILTIGLGMALPYLLLASFPDSLRYLPKPGRWMEMLRGAMGFIMLLVGIWLLSSVSRNTYPFKVAACGVVLVFCVWMWKKSVTSDTSLGRKIIAAALAVVIAAGGLTLLRASKPLAVELLDFDAVALESARREGKTVIVDFTAAWCITCKLVEATVYDNPEVAARLKELGVMAIKGDVTTEDAPANSLKNELGEAVPATVIFPPGDAQPIRLRGLFTKDDLFAALEHAVQTGKIAAAVPGNR